MLLKNNIVNVRSDCCTVQYMDTDSFFFLSDYWIFLSSSCIETSPTFWEFVQAVLRQNLLDDHWRPVASLCSLCNREDFAYDFVLRFENLAEEEGYLIRTLGLGEALRKRREHSNRALTEKERGRYFRTLDDGELRELYDFYRADFELFEYSLDGYVSESSKDNAKSR